MDGRRTQLRDRMLRDAIVEVLRSTFDPSDCGKAISLVDAEMIGHVTVEGDRVRIDLALSEQWSPFAGSLGSEVQRRIEALPEVTLTEVSVTVAEEGTASGITRSTCQ